MKRHKWSDIKARAKPETRFRIEAEAQRLSDDLHLSQLRKARGLTQETMAELLKDFQTNTVRGVFSRQGAMLREAPNEQKQTQLLQEIRDKIGVSPRSGQTVLVSG